MLQPQPILKMIRVQRLAKGSTGKFNTANFI